MKNNSNTHLKNESEEQVLKKRNFQPSRYKSIALTATKKGADLIFSSCKNNNPEVSITRDTGITSYFVFNVSPAKNGNGQFFNDYKHTIEDPSKVKIDVTPIYLNGKDGIEFNIKCEDNNITKRGTVVVTQENNDPNSKG